jgi:4,5:9,10-diseco-3-hydroxy-5,9,17-trioxoandrosta-1(10),2-diene-4-oate hydrolase
MQHGARRQGMEERFVDVLGARMHYLHAGSGRPMLLIHGLVGSSANWRRNIGPLAQRASVYAIDQVNMGKSQRVAGLDPSFEATADRIAAMMTALGIEEADIAGHSHGGAIALMLAARHPGRVRSLILFAPANPFSDLSDLLVRVYTTPLGGMAASIAPYFPEPLHRFALGRMYGDPSRITDCSLPGYIDGLRVRGTVPHILAIVRLWFADMAKLKAALPRVSAVPTQLIWGDRDRAVSLVSGEMLNRELGESEMTVVPGGGHVLFEEMPEESNRIMLAWLSRDLAHTLLPTKPAPRARKSSRPAAAASSARSAAGMHRQLPES